MTEQNDITDHRFRQLATCNSDLHFRSDTQTRAVTAAVQLHHRSRQLATCDSDLHFRYDTQTRAVTTAVQLHHRSRELATCVSDLPSGSNTRAVPATVQLRPAAASLTCRSKSHFFVRREGAAHIVYHFCTRLSITISPTFLNLVIPKTES